MDEIDASLARLRNAWIAGRSARDAAPTLWREALGDVDDLVLVALASQATDVLTRNAPSAPLVDRPVLPMLAAPLVPEALRPRLRRLLATPKTQPSLERSLIAFTAARGFAVHPADWMPSANDDWAPELYAPWLDWVRAEAPSTVSEADISTQNYEQWSWTERRRALEHLRARDPAAATAIIAAKAGNEPAERRLRLVELLADGLSQADADYLESLLKDRSDRVQTLARALLARLGRRAGAADGDTLAAELAAMLELRKVGLIHQRRQLVLKPLKTGAQLSRRRELFRLVGVTALAQALDATEAQLVVSMPNGSAGDLLDFSTCVAATASDASVRALLDRFLENADAPPELLRVLADRPSPADRIALLPRILAHADDQFETALYVSGSALGQASLAALKASPNFD
jgi:hypothetical protein